MQLILIYALMLLFTFAVLSGIVFLVSLTGLIVFKWSYVFIAWGIMILLRLLF